MRFFNETFVVFQRQLRLSLANPTWMAISILQPILYLTPVSYTHLTLPTKRIV